MKDRRNEMAKQLRRERNERIAARREANLNRKKASDERWKRQ